MWWKGLIRACGLTCDSSLCRGQADLALLIAQMQKNADLVEKDVLQAEELLAVVRTHL